MSLSVERAPLPHRGLRLLVSADGGAGPTGPVGEVREAACRTATGVRPVVLLVMDVPADLRLRIDMALRFSGYQVIHAVNGSEAVQVLQRGLQPALVVADPAAPGAGGPEFVASLRAHLRGAPIVCAGRPLAGTRGALERLGPGARSELLELLESLAFARR